MDGWSEIFDAEGNPRDVYRPLFERLLDMSRGRLRQLDDQLEATMREMGVTFDIVRDRPWGRRPWYCDLAPQIFTSAEWSALAAGVRQRVRAYEFFLRDVYGDQRILRQGILPHVPVLGSAHFQLPAHGLARADGAFLHLSGVAVGRSAGGTLMVKHHYFSHASGISYMIQNRRALARVIPQSLQDYSLCSIADTPTDILEMLRRMAPDCPEPMVVLLSPGQGSAVYSEHSFLARRMGIPLVQGGDLLIHNDHVYLKTVAGLERVHVIYNRLADAWLDPLVFRRDSMLGVPGLVQCIRKKSVAVLNAVGSQLADDRALLAFGPTIIRYYLGEQPLLDEVETYWLGDIEQRAMVLDEVERWVIRPVYGERIVSMPDPDMDEKRRQTVVREILENPAGYVAQADPCEAETICFDRGRRETGRQDHILFALRREEHDYVVFPGALTRLSTDDAPFTASELGGGSKDTWVESGPDTDADNGPRTQIEVRLPSHHVTSRVAESFYWIGRYLERARNLAGMIATIETLETEELNPTERQHYRPVWNRLLPPLEGAGHSRGTISNAAGRYRLALDMDEPGAVIRAVQQATWNGESLLECLSIEAWGVLNKLRERFEKQRFRPKLPDERLAVVTKGLCTETTEIVAQFFGIAETTMISDDGWGFCLVGEAVERAITTANAVNSMARALLRAPGLSREHAREIQLSAFLRLLGSRDVYRRVYQMRIESGPVLQLLWQNPVVPRSVARCLHRALTMLTPGPDAPSSVASRRLISEIEETLWSVRQVDWTALADAEIEHAGGHRIALRDSRLVSRLDELVDHVYGLHNLITDGFLNHQIHMRPAEQGVFMGFDHVI